MLLIVVMLGWLSKSSFVKHNADILYSWVHKEVIDCSAGIRNEFPFVQEVDIVCTISVKLIVWKKWFQLFPEFAME